MTELCHLLQICQNAANLQQLQQFVFFRYEDFINGFSMSGGQLYVIIITFLQEKQ